MPVLSPRQKADIGKLATRAWRAWPGRAEFLAANPELSPSACFAAWRHVEQGKAVGKQSLLDCTSECDFLRLCAHFLRIAREYDAANSAQLRAGTESRRIAEHKLREELRERGLAEEYAASICRRQFRCALREANAKQLWCLVFTIRNRRKPLPATQ